MQTKFIRSETVAEATMRFHFAKPEGFLYRAGQSIDLTLKNPPETDDEGNTRAFSLSSAPHDEHIAITTRMRDTAYKRVLGAMEPGTVLNVDGPFGDLVMPEREHHVVMLAGGIGVTPFYSMARDAVARSLPHRITLFYSNRRPEDAAFLTELAALHSENANFTFVPTMTGMEKSSQEWNGEQGYIDASMLEKYAALADAPLYYLAGPPAMVAALRKTLNDSGISNDDIRTESFTGY